MEYIQVIRPLTNTPMNDNLTMYLSNRGEPSPDDGGGAPSYFVSRRKLMIDYVNIKICI